MTGRSHFIPLHLKRIAAQGVRAAHNIGNLTQNRSKSTVKVELRAVCASRSLWRAVCANTIRRARVGQRDRRPSIAMQDFKKVTYSEYFTFGVLARGNCSAALAK